MKTYLKPLRRSAAAVGLFGLLSLFSSCLKDHSNYIPPPTALVSFFQASTTLPALDVYFNSNRVNWNPVIYGTGLSYVRAYTGLRTFNFYTYNQMNLQFTDTATLKADTVYSMFLTGTSAKTDFLIVKDHINQPPQNKATIRFADLSPDAPAVDLVLADTIRVANTVYKGISQFIPIPGDKVYNLQVRQTGTNTVLATLNNISLSANNVYTIMLTGLASGTAGSNNQLAVYYVNNAFF